MVSNLDLAYARRPEVRINLGIREGYDCDFSNFQGNAAHSPLASRCYIRNLAYEKAVFIWGDSHAKRLVNSLIRNLPSFWQVLRVASAGCPPRLDTWDPTRRQPVWEPPDALAYTDAAAPNYCAHSNSFALQAIRDSKPDVVVLAQDDMQDNIRRLVVIATEVERLGVKKVIIAGPAPHWKFPLPNIVIRKFFDKTPRRTYVDIDMGLVAENEELKKQV